MTDDELHKRLIDWIATVINVTVIASHQGGDLPALPYVECNLLGSEEVFRHENDVAYNPPEVGAVGLVTATPDIEREYHFSLHAFALVQPTDVLRPLASAHRVLHGQLPDLVGAVIHDMGRIRSVPDFINEKWRPRAQADLYVRALTRDGFIVDVIDAIEPFQIIREG